MSESADSREARDAPLPAPSDGASAPGASAATPHPGAFVGDDVASQFELVAARLLSVGQGGHFALAVTSSVLGEGVSTVSAGLAVTLANSTTKRVLLVDANLRHPSLHQLFGVSAQPGLHELVEGNQISALPTALPNLWVVSSGAPVEHAVQLMTSEAAIKQLRLLRERFDYLIIDCPPVLSAAETISICRLANGVIIVVRSGLTPRDDVARARGMLEGTPVMGVILNGV